METDFLNLIAHLTQCQRFSESVLQFLVSPLFATILLLKWVDLLPLSNDSIFQTRCKKHHTISQLK